MMNNGENERSYDIIRPSRSNGVVIETPGFDIEIRELRAMNNSIIQMARAWCVVPFFLVFIGPTRDSAFLCKALRKFKQFSFARIYIGVAQTRSIRHCVHA